ncbi:MAG: hypothetical protein LQ338_001028 [Usnochroma carphineum]|nr:MAG: hypothetical protein LQ338_001028 [Usnochroma carphineum]
MPLSKKEQRKVSRALGRSESGSYIQSRSSSFSPAQDLGESITVSIDASAEDTTSRLENAEARKSSTARCLSDTFASLAVQRLPAACRREEHVSNDGATVRPKAPYHLLLDGRCPDPFLDSNEQTASGAGGGISKLDDTQDDSGGATHRRQRDAGTGSASRLLADLKDDINQTWQIRLPVSQEESLKSAKSSAQSAPASHRRLVSTEDFPPLPTSKPGSPQEVRQTSPEYQSASDDVDEQGMRSPEKSDVNPLTPIEIHDIPQTYFPESFDGTKDHRSDSSPSSSDLVVIDSPARRERWNRNSPSTFASFKDAARPASTLPVLPPLRIPDAIRSQEPEASEHNDTASEVQSQGTTLVEYHQPDDAALTDMGQSLRSMIAARILNQSSIGYAPGHPWGFHPRNEHPWFNSPEHCVPNRYTFDARGAYGSIPSVYNNLSASFGRQHGSIALPTSLPPRRGQPTLQLTNRYELSFYETSLQRCRRMRYPDWAQDARGRVGIPKPKKVAVRTKMMNEYTRRFYGGDLDAARDLHRVGRPKREFDLGGLLP